MRAGEEGEAVEVEVVVSTGDLVVRARSGVVGVRGAGSL